MDDEYQSLQLRSRRGFLQQTAGGLGAIALMHLLKGDECRASVKGSAVQPHFRPKGEERHFPLHGWSSIAIGSLGPET